MQLACATNSLVISFTARAFLGFLPAGFHLCRAISKIIY
jgi:hypothetical protein